MQNLEFQNVSVLQNEDEKLSNKISGIPRIDQMKRLNTHQIIQTVSSIQRNKQKYYSKQ